MYPTFSFATKLRQLRNILKVKIMMAMYFKMEQLFYQELKSPRRKHCKCEIKYVAFLSENISPANVNTIVKNLIFGAYSVFYMDSSIIAIYYPLPITIKK